MGQSKATKSPGGIRRGGGVGRAHMKGENPKYTRIYWHTQQPRNSKIHLSISHGWQARTYLISGLLQILSSVYTVCDKKTLGLKVRIRAITFY